MCLQTESLRLEGDRTASREGINNCRWPIRVAPTNLCSRRIEYGLIVGVLPFDELSDDLKQTLSLVLLRLTGRELIGMGGRVVYQLGEQHCAASCQRASCPPEMQSRWVAVADAFFSCCFTIDVVKGEGYLDQLGRHQCCVAFLIWAA